MKLSNNFTLEELTVTNSGLPNLPNEKELANLKQLVSKVIQPLRDELDIPITINSGFRSSKVNAKIGGAATSQHCKGEAADLDCSDNKLLFDTIRTKFKFDQLIWENGDDTQPAWVHVSYSATRLRGEVIRVKNGKYTKY